MNKNNKVVSIEPITLKRTTKAFLIGVALITSPVIVKLGVVGIFTINKILKNNPGYADAIDYFYEKLANTINAKSEERYVYNQKKQDEYEKKYSYAGKTYEELENEKYYEYYNNAHDIYALKQRQMDRGYFNTDFYNVLGTRDENKKGGFFR